MSSKKASYKVHKRPVADSDDEPAPIAAKNVPDSHVVCGNEILTICIGQCGVNMGYEYVSTIMREHKLDAQGTFTGDISVDNSNRSNNHDVQLLSKMNACFKCSRSNSSSSLSYAPRTIFFDSDRSSIDGVRQSRLSRVFARQYLFDGGAESKPCGLYPIGYNRGMDVIYESMDMIRAEVESFDSFQGTQLIHSVDGGCGAGFSSLLLHKLSDEYPKTMRVSHVCGSDLSGRRTASYGAHNLMLTAYNRVLAVDQLVRHCDLNTMLNNGLLLRYTAQAQAQATTTTTTTPTTYAEMNCMASLVLSGITSPLRFVHEPQICDNLHKMNAFFSVFPRLHFLNVSHAPFILHQQKDAPKCDDHDILHMNGGWCGNDVSNVKLEDGKLFCTATFYRTCYEKAMHGVHAFMEAQNRKMSDDFVAWIPHNVATGFVFDGAFHAYKAHATLMSTTLMNCTAQKASFQRLSAAFARAYKRRAFVFHYVSNGMEYDEFEEADQNIRDLITEYQDKQDAYVDSEEEGDSEEDSMGS
eukprot:CAMPEP_0202692116 /NCGR_PEP_ID=MMETSP1385-20130828/6582_1 /ASSEMBLY_ACC=CAM_ASM_000861 /TAXON_ID=933848 /ORGANISM="Elphidium margaritaceum" /LENGTH=525 /DNA_ID=CAMNT_0049347593 /DNA_START=30 /DNA_END=1607 /DNA_ORIENTATION=+